MMTVRALRGALLAGFVVLLTAGGLSAPAEALPRADAATGTSVSASPQSSRKYTLVLLEGGHTAWARRDGPPVYEAVGFYIPRGDACGEYVIGGVAIRFPTGTGGVYIMLPPNVGGVTVRFWPC